MSGMYDALVTAGFGEMVLTKAEKAGLSAQVSSEIHSMATLYAQRGNMSYEEAENALINMAADSRRRQKIEPVVLANLEPGLDIGERKHRPKLSKYRYGKQKRHGSNFTPPKKKRK